MPQKIPPCRLVGYLAPKADVAVLLRRGPTRWFQLIKWDMKKDTFESGQWFRGSIYVDKCDLSHDGELFVYFAAKHQRKLTENQVWTAVSKPPYFTALAVWPNTGTYYGGGYFISARSMYLAALGKTEILGPPPELRVTSEWPEACGDHPGWNMFRARALRDGWAFVDEGNKTRVSKKSKRSGEYALNYWVTFYHMQPFFNVPEYTRQDENTFVLTGPRDQRITLSGVTWADWDRKGRLVYAMDGAIYVRPSPPYESTIQLADFNALTPKRIKAPEWATRI